MSLSSISNVGLSGINAALLQEAAASNNIANAASEPQRRLVVSQTALPGGGVAAQLTSSPHPTGDLITDIITHIGSLYSLKANIISIRTADEMTGSTLNLRA